MSWNEVEKTKTNNSEFYKLESGDNKIRLLTDPVRLMKYFDNATKKSKISFEHCGYSNEAKVKWLCYVFDYKLNKTMLAEFPHSVMKQILEYRNNPEYAFETAPMPYDITIKKTGEKLETEYSVIPARQNTEVPKEVLEELAKKKTCQEIKKAMQDRELEKLSADPEWKKDYEERIALAKSEEIDYPENTEEDIPF